MFFSLLLLTLCLTSVEGQSSQPYFGCSSFWPGVTPGQANTIPGQCQLYPGFPEIIGTTSVTVVYSSEWGQSVGVPDKLDPLASTIHRAAERSLAIYETLARVPDIVIVLTTLVGPTDGNGWTADAYEFMPTSPQGPCEILLYVNWAIGALQRSQQEAEQIIASEMYHCVQAARLGNELNQNAAVWVIEGSADYFSNVVYPLANSEWSDFGDYHPEWPIYNHTGAYSYATELFFQSLEQSKGIVYINSWVLSTKETQSEHEERTRLSTLAAFADDFHLFAQQYSLGSIRDTGGQMIRIPNPPVPTQIGFTFINDDGTSGNVSLSAKTFTITVYELDLGTGQVVSILSNAQGNQRLAYRQSRDVVWTPMPSGSVDDAQGTIIVPCDDGNLSSIFILFTSTKDVDSSSVTITVNQLYKDDTCSGISSTKSSTKSSTQSSTKSSPSPISITPAPTCLGSEATPCYSGPAGSVSTHCIYGVSCWPTAWTSIFSSYAPQPCLAICGDVLTVCETSTVSNPGYLSAYEVYCSG